MKTVIVLVSTEYSNGRAVCEEIEGQTFVNASALAKTLETKLAIPKIDGIVDEDDLPEPQFYNIEDFTQAVNDQVLDVLTNDFICYVNVEK
jgi:hypothetical protein